MLGGTHCGGTSRGNLLARATVLFHQPVNRSTARVQSLQAIDVVQGRTKDHGWADGTQGELSLFGDFPSGLFSKLFRCAVPYPGGRRAGDEQG